MKRYFLTVIKLLGCGTAFFIGTMLGGMIATLIGLPAPSIPQGTEPAILASYLFLASLGIGALLAYLAAQIPGNLYGRWLVLTIFGWVVYSFTTYIEALIYTSYASASPYKVVMDLVAFALSSLAAVLCFSAPGRGRISIRSWLALHTPSWWFWRLVTIWIAFPVIYLSAGKLVEPLVIEYYRQGLFELKAPSWGQILSTQALRSLLFLIVCLAILICWNRSRLSLFASLSAALFLLGGFYMLQAYWYPAGFRLIHSLEMLADSITYAGCLVGLFWQEARSRLQQPTARLEHP